MGAGGKGGHGHGHGRVGHGHVGHRHVGQGHGGLGHGGRNRGGGAAMTPDIQLGELPAVASLNLVGSFPACGMPPNCCIPYQPVARHPKFPAGGPIEATTPSEANQAAVRAAYTDQQWEAFIQKAFYDKFQQHFFAPCPFLCMFPCCCATCMYAGSKIVLMQTEICTEVAAENVALKARLRAMGVTGPHADMFWVLGNGMSRTAQNYMQLSLLTPLASKGAAPVIGVMPDGQPGLTVTGANGVQMLVPLTSLPAGLLVRDANGSLEFAQGQPGVPSATFGANSFSDGNGATPVLAVSTNPVPEFAPMFGQTSGDFVHGQSTGPSGTTVHGHSTVHSNGENASGDMSYNSNNMAMAPDMFTLDR